MKAPPVDEEQGATRRGEVVSSVDPDRYVVAARVNGRGVTKIHSRRRGRSVEEGLGGQHFGQCPRSGDVVQVSGFGTAEVLEQFRVERHGRNVVAMVDEE
jgi:hypothetical protein